MSPDRVLTSEIQTRFATPKEEIPPMSFRLTRSLDVIASILIMVLAIGTGAATAVLGA